MTLPKQSITLDGANALTTAALVRAKELGLAEVIAVYDESEVLKALVSMDGARITRLTSPWTRLGPPRDGKRRRRIWRTRSALRHRP
jgi:hypothetical protein